MKWWQKCLAVIGIFLLLGAITSPEIVLLSRTNKHPTPVTLFHGVCVTPDGPKGVTDAVIERKDGMWIIHEVNGPVIESNFPCVFVNETDGTKM